MSKITEEMIQEITTPREETLNYLMYIADADNAHLKAIGYSTKEDALIKTIARYRERKHIILKD